MGLLFKIGLIFAFRIIAEREYALPDAVARLFPASFAPSPMQQRTLDRVEQQMRQREIRWPVAAQAETVPEAPDTVETAQPQPVLTGMAVSADAQTRLRALEGIARNPSIEYLGAVLAALADPTFEVRSLAADSLAYFDPDPAFEGLMNQLCANWPDSAVALGESLPLLGNPMRERMLAVLQSPAESGLRRAATAYALGRMGYRQALTPLTECALQSDDTILAVTSARALYALNDTAALPCYAQLVRHVSPEVRSAALAGLAALAVPQSVEILAAVASEMDKSRQQEQEYAVELLGKTTHETAIPALIDIMKRNLAMRSKAAEALRALTGLDLGEMPSAWEDWYAQRDTVPEDTAFLPGGAWPPPWLDPQNDPQEEPSGTVPEVQQPVE
ncbi:MAG: hypothetical protein QG656_839 [Candidatus Hydrogenedentes bacterium]|nr:hypothetical protein [Candidatus Hydrogenedentota bacterium]